MPDPGEGSTCRKCRKDIVWIDDGKTRAWTAVAGDSGTWCVDESSHEPMGPHDFGIHREEEAATPHPHQRAVIEAVCGLATALMHGWGRGSGRSWTRRRIAERILSEHDDASPKMPLGYYAGSVAEAAELSGAIPADSVHLRNQVRVGDPVGYEVQLKWNPDTRNEHWRTDTDFIVSTTRITTIDDILERALSYIEDQVANMVPRDHIRLVAVCSVEKIS